MSWESYADDEGIPYYFNSATGVSTYDTPKGFCIDGCESNPVTMMSNPSKGSGGATEAASAEGKAVVQMGDLVDVDRTGSGGFERAKIIAVHIGGYEAYRDDEGASSTNRCFMYDFSLFDAVVPSALDGVRGEREVMN